MDPTHRLLTLHEAADRLGLTYSAVRGLQRRGNLPTVQVGRRVYVPLTALDALVNPPAPGAPPDPDPEYAVSAGAPPKVLKFTPRPKRSSQSA